MPPARAKTQYIYKSTHERKGIVEIGDRAFGGKKMDEGEGGEREKYYSRGEPRNLQDKVESRRSWIEPDHLEMGQVGIYSTPWLSALLSPVNEPPSLRPASIATISAKISSTSLGTVLSYMEIRSLGWG